ncbi:hypothetical protein [Nocardia salmonicida]|uniref:hypothetical protein n=1 Tax=Nocardia salmonicida TaxID=53431 RepID=UPI0036361E75
MVDQLTDQQRTALDDLLTFAHEHGVECHPRDFDVSRVNEHGDIRAHYSDSDYVIAAHIDPYGRTGLCFGAVEWVHLGDSDDDCQTCHPAGEMPAVHVDGRPIRTVNLPEMETAG